MYSSNKYCADIPFRNYSLGNVYIFKELEINGVNYFLVQNMLNK